LAGSAFVIAIIEEFFWRGFLYRWMLGRFFLDVDHGKMSMAMLLVVSLIFGLEHARWLAGIIAGLAYGLLYIKTRDIWAASIAHVITNMLLGEYVLITGSYAFW
jgi:CAAX prenyl protease-like protein